MKKLWKKSAAAFAAAGLLAAQCALFPANAEQNSVPDFSYMGAVGNYTAAQTQTLAQEIYDGLANHESVITLSVKWNSMFDWQSISDIYRAVLAGWDVGVLTSRVSGGFDVSRRNYIQIVPAYLVEDSEYDAVYADMTEKINSITANVSPDWSDAEKALYLHEYMAVAYNYDYSSDDSELKYTPYGLLSTGQGVCEAYARLYNILMHRVGVESSMVECTSMGHAWNLVCLDDCWYHVDVTWDDSYQLHGGLVRHVNFLKTSDEMLETNHSYTSQTEWKLSSGQIVLDLPTSDFYTDAFWNQCNSAIQQYQGEWFAVHCDPANQNTTAWFDLCDFHPESGTADITHLNSLDAKWARWYVFDQEGYYWPGTYITPAVVNGILYYTTPDAVFAWQNGQVIWLFNLDEEQKQLGYLYGMYADGMTLHYYVSVSPNNEDTPTEYTIDLSGYQDYVELVAGTVQTEPETTTTTTTTTTSTTTQTTTTTTTSTTPQTTTTTTTSTTPQTTTTTTTSTTPQTTTTTTTSTTPQTTTTTTTSTTPQTTTTTTTSTTPAPAETATEPAAVSGDLDGDYQISVQDVIIVQKYLLGSAALTQEEYLQADVTKDEIVNIYDLLAMKRILLHELQA